MPLVIIGLLLVAAKLAELGPVADLAWWWVLSPFGAAVAWWAVADATGVTQRRAMEKMEKRKLDRRDRAMEDLGLDVRRKQSADRALGQAQRRASTPKEPGL